LKEIDFRLSTSYGPGRYDPDYEEKGVDYPYAYVRWTEQRNMEAFLALIQAGQVKTAELTTHRFPIERAEEAYHRILDNTEPYLGVILQ
jgi:threonine dehydrogenase-like Zn-dependent dehydrogenase